MPFLHTKGGVVKVCDGQSKVTVCDPLQPDSRPQRLNIEASKDTREVDADVLVDWNGM